MKRHLLSATLLCALFITGIFFGGWQETREVENRLPIKRLCLSGNTEQDEQIIRATLVLVLLYWAERTTNGMSFEEVSQWLPSSLVPAEGALNRLPETEIWDFDAQSSFGTRNISLAIDASCEIHPSWGELRLREGSE